MHILQTERKHSSLKERSRVKGCFGGFWQRGGARVTGVSCFLIAKMM